MTDPFGYEGDLAARRRGTWQPLRAAGGVSRLTTCCRQAQARRLHHQRVALAQAHGQVPPTSSRLYDELVYGAGSWAQPWRVVLKAEVMQAGDNPRFVVTSLEAPSPQMLYEDLYCARGNCENDIKAVSNYSGPKRVAQQGPFRLCSVP